MIRTIQMQDGVSIRENDRELKYVKGDKRLIDDVIDALYHTSAEIKDAYDEGFQDGVDSCDKVGYMGTDPCED
jgi:hypothetical protein